MDILTILIVAVLIATVAVLFAGIYSMARGGKYDEQHSEQFMFGRVALQAAGIILIVAAVLYATM
ncbi:MAG: twin transmembrane helix small protein [Gammaproteobacteria bacterium]|nr:twin transmembrane helix small protein [Gammaproteobacteria bacterium]MDH4254823.1 twin transmembrane helix small protein [Gammaproteobacteria bacterium]MDH5309843.1 twin transmembrane helix small protein [Gammaproteobacteria bacterium]